MLGSPRRSTGMKPRRYGKLSTTVISDGERGTDDDTVSLFVDFSNVSIGARYAGRSIEHDVWGTRIHAEGLYRLMAGGRPVRSSWLVANRSVEASVIRHFRPFFEILWTETGIVTGRDQAADELLQNRIWWDLDAKRPDIFVLATGDGAGVTRDVGFLPPLRGVRRHGRGVEVVAFDASLHGHLRRLASMPGNALVLLDRHLRSITFEPGGRRPLPVSLCHRPYARPHPWTPGELDWLVLTDHTEAA